MTDWTPQDDWSQVKIGDPVRAMRAEQMLTGEVVDRLFSSLFHGDNIYALVLKVPDLADVLQIHQGYWQLSVPAKPAVELPTDQGAVITWFDGTYFPQIAQLDPGDRGQGWFYESNGDSLFLTAEELIVNIGSAPYTRLEPIAVTAKKVLEDVSKFAWADGFMPQLRELSNKYGVTDD